MLIERYFGLLNFLTHVTIIQGDLAKMLISISVLQSILPSCLTQNCSNRLISVLGFLCMVRYENHTGSSAQTLLSETCSGPAITKHKFHWSSAKLQVRSLKPKLFLILLAAFLEVCLLLSRRLPWLLVQVRHLRPIPQQLCFDNMIYYWR